MLYNIVIQETVSLYILNFIHLWLEYVNCDYLSIKLEMVLRSLKFLRDRNNNTHDFPVAIFVNFPTTQCSD